MSATTPRAAQPPGATIKIAQPTRHVHALRPHPDNPRDEVSRDDPKIVEMAASIRMHGVIEPLVVTPDNVVIAGHRRRVAAMLAGLEHVPVTIREVAPDAAVELMLTENMQRESLSPLEEARAIHALMGRRKLTVADASRQLALDPKVVSERLAILKCEPQVQALFGANELPLGAAPWLARILNADKQVNYAGLLARRQITIAKLKDVVGSDGVAPAPKPTQAARETAADIPSRRAALTPGGKKSAPAKNAPDRLGGGPAPPTRAEAMAKLSRAINERRVTKITLHSVKALVEAQCCSCGMSGQEEVCRACPFPRLILGIVGRAD